MPSIVEEAKKSGIIFDNLILQYQGHIYAKQKEKNKKARIVIPKEFIIPREALEIDIDHHYVSEYFVKDERIRNFINMFLNFLFSQENMEKFKKLVIQYNELDEKIKNALDRINVFFKDYSDLDIKDLILKPFFFEYNNKDYFIPFIESYNLNKLKSLDDFVFEGEDILLPVVNRKYDSLFFVSEFLRFIPTPNTYAVKQVVNINEYVKLQVGRNFEKLFDFDYENIDVLDEEDDIKLFYYLLIGSKLFYKKPYKIFEKHFKEIFKDKKALNHYSKIKSESIKVYTHLLKDFEEKDNEFSKLLKDSLIQVLMNIGYSVEEIE